MAKLKTAGYIGSLAGSAGGVTFRRMPGGVQIIDREAPRDRNTPAQAAARKRMAEAGRAWRAMSAEQVDRWRTYARTQAPSPLEPPPSAVNVFKALAIRVLAIDPNATIPTVPPSQPFGGDGVILQVEGGPQGVTFVPDRPNAPGVVTELLFQRLPSPHRAAYEERYRSQRFVAMAADPVLVEARPGLYACAARFLRSATGQAGPLLALGMVEVG